MSEAGLAVSVSVLMHVAWNLIARQQAKEAYPLWWVLLAHLVLLGPWGFYHLWLQTDWTPRFAGLLAISALANVVYFLGLRKAYEHAPVSLVYPLVRSSPLLIAAWGAWLFDQPLPATAWLGIAVSVLGLWWMASGALRSHDRGALPWAGLAMLATSVYSLSDKAATASVPSFAGLVGFISVGYLASWISISVALKRSTGAWMPARRIGAAAWLAGGLCIGLAYALVIHAMRYLPSAEVVSYTNAGIVVATVLSITLFRERMDWRRRLGGALVITGGLAIMAC